MAKKYSDLSVYDAACQRLDYVYSRFNKVYVCFSGGKDSGVMLHMAIAAATRHRKLPVDVLIIDLEAQYQHTVDFMLRMSVRPDVRVHWICLPIRLRNAVSQYKPHWTCWDTSKRPAWVRDFPDTPWLINDESYFPFFRKGMEFEKFMIDYGNWFSDGEDTACLVGIRSSESLNRYNTIGNRKKATYKGWQWSTKMADTLYNFYPLYDWTVQDIWTANARFGYDYNKIYDLMYLAGVPLSQMRLCQPYGDDQRKGLYLFKILEPDTWMKVVNRVEGANFGNRYSRNNRMVFANFRMHLPDGHTYKSYAAFLLSTMPPHLRRHYEKKIHKFMQYWAKHGFENDIPDAADPHLESQKKAPSWRRICKVLLKNDYWCKGLSFAPTKRDIERQLKFFRLS